MIIAGTVKHIYSATDSGPSLPRPVAEKLVCIERHGIEGDKFAGGDLERTVMVLGQKSYDMAEEAAIRLAPGSLGENILLDFDPHDFIYGTRFQIGEAVLEITDDCSMCKHLSQFDPALPKLLMHRRGRYCKILKGGTITAGQIVSLPPNSQETTA